MILFLLIYAGMGAISCIVFDWMYHWIIAENEMLAEGELKSANTSMILAVKEASEEEGKFKFWFSVYIRIYTLWFLYAIIFAVEYFNEKRNRK